MKNYIIAKDKGGSFKQYNNLNELKDDIDNISSWLKIKAKTFKKSVEMFPVLQDKYDKVNKSYKLNHVINLND